ncbi:MAG TPA: PTS sugar transporter subunit IIB [Candidatus Cryosericum sp.]|jgi:PTS system mannose-specific IIB component|nr:PTS sugar transporter subunit IIB [Candidatus Cryosericum sp.]
MAFFLHIDNRLIHGQVTVSWCSYYGAKRIVVADDKVAADPIQRIILPQAARGLPTSVVSIADALKLLPTLDPAHESVLIIARNAEGALALLQGGLRPKSINVGNQAPVQGTKYVMVLPWIAATKEDAQAFKAMSDMGYKITPQRSSSDRALDLVELLGKKGLL